MTEQAIPEPKWFLESCGKPAEAMQMLQEAGVQGISPFFSAFTWHGWGAYA